jgi:RNase H-fold protein (predicted Holliday junction resolvase)
MLKNMGLNRRQRNEREDMVAASMILETALESVKKL